MTNKKEIDSLTADVNAVKKDIAKELLNDDTINAVLDLISFGYTTVKDVSIEENIKTALDTLDKIDAGEIDADEETRAEVEKRTNKNYWIDELKKKAEYSIDKINGAKNNPISKRPNYIKLVKYLTAIRKTKNTEQKENEILNAYGDELLEFSNMLPSFTLYYLEQIKKLDPHQATKIAVLSILRGDLNEDLELFKDELIHSIDESNYKYVGALASVRNNLDNLVEKAHVKENKNVLALVIDVEKKENREIVPRVFYSDEMLISHSEYINSLVKNGFKLDASVFNESEEMLKKLKGEDNDILDLLMLNWYDAGVRRFTDRQIAIQLHHSNDPDADVKQDELKKINDSIDRLRKTDIKQGIESIEKIDSSKLKITESTMLISVIKREIQHNGNTTVYDFTGVQGYYLYAQATNKTSRYSNALITADIKGIQHDFKNDNLRRLLLRRVTGLSIKEKKHTAIDMREIYETLEITDPRKYSYVKKKVKTILEELRNDENDIYYNFTYAFKKRNKETLIVFSRDNSNPLEVDQRAEK